MGRLSRNTIYLLIALGLCFGAGVAGVSYFGLRSVLQGSPQEVAGREATQTAQAPRATSTLVVTVTPTPAATLTGIPSVTPAPSQDSPTGSPAANSTTPAAVSSSTSTPKPAATASPAPAGRKRKGNGPDFIAPKLVAGEFVLDGQLNEWGGEGVPLMYPHDEAKKWQGAQDLSGTAWLGWNDGYLLVAVRVVDDVHVQTQIGWEMYKGDSVEVWIDSELEGDFDNPKGDADDWQLGLSPGDFRSLPPEGVVYIPVRDAGLNRQIRVTALPAPDGYTIEAEIPWSVLQVRPHAGLVLGVVVDLSDNDTPGTAQQQKQSASNPNFKFNQPLTFGNLILQ